MNDDWKESAVCRGDLTFGQDRSAAAETCADCPVRRECEAWAESEICFDGIAGGYDWCDGINRANNRTKRRILTTAETAIGHDAYVKGYRSEYAIEAHRAWDRGRKQRSRGQL